MRKKIVEDITPRRSIKDISITRNPKTKPFVLDQRPEMSEPKTQQDTAYFDEPTPKDKLDFREKYNLKYDIDKPEKESRKGLYVTLFVFVLALAFGISSLLTKANIKLVPKKDNFTIKESFLAKKDQPNGEFGYQMITVEDTVSKEVQAISEQTVNEKASGMITVYNETDKTQILIATTRFENESGLIFRIKDKISIPPQKTVSGKKIPGTIETTIYADEVGDKYNIGITNWTVPGLKNDPKYKNIYAKSKTDMAGGFSGVKKAVDENAKKTANIELSADLKKKLLAQIETQIPDNFILYTNTVDYIFTDAVEQQGQSQSVNLTKNGKIIAYIFDKKLLSNKLISIIEEKNGKINYNAEVFNLKDAKINIDRANTNQNEISINIEGDISIVSVFDKTILKNDLMGLKKSDITEFLKAKYPGILEAKINIFPFWKSKIPLKSDNINIEEVSSI